MFSGAHIVLFTTDVEADRAFFRDVLELDNVDTGGGWLIFALPKSEVAFHPHETSTAHEFSFMCESMEATRAKLIDHGIACTEPVDEGWGLLASLTLPGGGTIGFYEPKHPSP